jgi:hypothetical protein
MSRVSEDAFPPETPSGSGEQPAGESASPSGTTVNFNFVRGPQGVGVGTALALTMGASVATFIYMRRRARARVQRLAWLAIRATLVRALLVAVLPRAARGAATFGGLGGGVLAAAVLRDRMRRASSQTTIDELSERVAQLQAQVDARSALKRPAPRDLIMGIAIGLGAAGIIGRATAKSTGKSS